MDEFFKKLQRFSHRFTAIQFLSLVAIYPIILHPKFQNKLHFFLFLGVTLLYVEFGINYLLEKIFKGKFDKPDKAKSILESWSLAFIGVHVSLLIFIIAQIQFNVNIHPWLIVLYLIILLSAILLFIKGRSIRLPSYSITEKLHKFEFRFRKEAFIIFFIGWVIHFTQGNETIRLIALLIAFASFVYCHLGNFVKLKELDELERQIKLEQAYLVSPIAIGVFYLGEFIRSTYNIGFSTRDLFWIIAATTLFLFYIVRKKYQ